MPMNYGALNPPAIYNGLTLRAWALFLAGATPTLYKSSGVTSVTYQGTGNWNINLSAPMADTSAVLQVVGGPPVPTTTNYVAAVVAGLSTIGVTTYSGGSAADTNTRIYVAVYG